MKTLSLFLALLISLQSFALAACNSGKANPQSQPKEQRTNSKKKQKIQVALLLDTSNSMDGLIDQAKSRLWDIVNTMSALRSNGQAADLEIALYQYGNSGLSSQLGYVQKVLPFTSDLDLISKNLFSLTTNGGDEYCGEVIMQSLSQLDWTSEEGSLKMIYIAGNEPFNQGPTNYKSIISYQALAKDVVVNTIFCGPFDQGVNTLWKDGADLGKGQYFAINSDKAIVYVPSPYDQKIKDCNEKLNRTYLYYGSQGKERFQEQAQQDSNAGQMSEQVAIKRASTKASRAYKNTSWDLVDKMEEDENYIEKVDNNTLPEELKDKSREEQKEIIQAKAKEREKLQNEIAELNKKRDQYVNENSVEDKDDDFGKAVNRSIIQNAQNKGFEVSK